MGFLFVLVLIAVGWLVYRYVSQGKLDLLRDNVFGSSRSPEDILKGRLAEGKIDQKEYDRIIARLRS